MQLTAKRQQLVNDAIAAGYTVQHDDQAVHIFKRHGGNKRIIKGITMFPSGTAIRADISLEVCLSIRTIKAMREQLGV
jgi:hypothetical protein